MQYGETTYLTNPAITIYGPPLTGIQAFSIMKNLFFHNEKDAEKADEWATQFTPAERARSMLFFYKRKLRVHFKIGFKFIIDGKSVLGEQRGHDDAAKHGWMPYLV